MALIVSACIESSLFLQDILVSVQSTVISRIEAVNLCPGEQYHMEFRVNRKYLELSTPLKKDSIYSEDHQRQFAILDKAMEGTVVTYLGGLPGIFIFSSVFKKYIFN